MAQESVVAGTRKRGDVIIYKWECNAAGIERRYIGQTAKGAKSRESNHRSSARKGKHGNRKIQAVWDKYGEGAFSGLIPIVSLWHPEFDTLTLRDIREYLATLETEAIREHEDAGYVLMNLAPAGGSCLGVKASAETRAKLSAASKGKPKSLEHRASLSEAHRGKSNSAETRAKLSVANKGRPKSAEHAAKVGVAHKGKIVSAEARAKMSAAGAAPSAETRARMSKASTGREVSAETRAKISEANLGKPRSYGRKVSAETRSKTSKALLGRPRATETLLKMRGKAKSTNTSGYPCVSKTHDGKWLGRFQVDGKYYNAGVFPTPSQADAAVKALRADLATKHI